MQSHQITPVPKKTISVVLSFFNERDVLPELIQRLRKVFAELIQLGKIEKYELVFVNDCSTDESEKYLKSEMSKGDIVILNTSRNFGVSECCLAGFGEARGDAVIYMDSDLQDPPELIPKLIEQWQADSEVEVVYTTRTKREDEGFIKLMVTKYGYRVINALSDIHLAVDSGDFKLLSRRAVNHMLQFGENKPYLRGLVSWIGYKQAQVFYERSGRLDGRGNSKLPVLSRRVIYYWLDRALISFSDAPLKIILVLGFLVSCISFLYLFVIVFQKIMGWYTPGWPALMFAILFLSGIQMTMLGFIGLYVGGIFQEVKKRPHFILKNVIRSDGGIK